jgi:hypothetical protein
VSRAEKVLELLHYAHEMIDIADVKYFLNDAIKILEGENE